MSRYLGDFAAGKTVRAAFNSVNPSTGAPASLTTGTYQVTKDGADVTPSGGVTLTADAGGVTGRNTLVVDTSADATTFTSGSDYKVRLAGSSAVAGVSVVGIYVAEFSLQNRSVVPDALGRVQVQVGTGAGQINGSGGKVPATLAAGDVTGNVNSAPQSLPAMPAGWVTAPGLSSGALGALAQAVLTDTADTSTAGSIGYLAGHAPSWYAAPPTAAQNRAEMDANSTKFAALVAGQTTIYNAVSSITSNTSRTVDVVPSQMPIPSSGSAAFELDLILFDLSGNNEAADFAPVVHARNAAGTSRDDHLGSTTMSAISGATGRYKATYTVQSTDAAEVLYLDYTATVGGVARTVTGQTTVTTAIATTFTTADRTTLNNLAASYTAARAGYLDNLNVGGPVAAAAAVGADTPGTAALAARLTAARAGFLDNLNVGGLVSTFAGGPVQSVTNPVTLSAADEATLGYLKGALVGGNTSVFTAAALANSPLPSGPAAPTVADIMGYTPRLVNQDAAYGGSMAGPAPTVEDLLAAVGVLAYGAESMPPGQYVRNFPINAGAARTFATTSDTNNRVIARS